MSRRLASKFVAALIVSVLLVSWALAVRTHDENMAKAIGPDGRYHACGLVTQQGVTEHLDAYRLRCAKDGE